jgi:dCTP deaminase
MALSDTEIVKALKEGRLFIHPFNPKQVTSCAYDVRLGNYVIRHRSSPIVENNGFSEKYTNPWSSSYQYWSWPELPKKVETEEEAEKTKLNIGDEYHLINPGELILAHTVEFIGGLKNLTTKMQARSSIARVGLTICSCAGLGDCGFTNRWCMEIRNSSSETLVLPVGKRIGQIIFIPLENCSINYSENGNYQVSTNPWEVVENWSPQELYPRLWKNEDPSWTSEEVDAVMKSRDSLFATHTFC